MPRAIGLRYFFIAALVFAVGTIEVGMAATSSDSRQYFRQDLGDDDGDGIPNYLDPDDNNDGILDRDTPLPTSIPVKDSNQQTPPADVPVEETPVPEETGQTPVDATTPTPPPDVVDPTTPQDDVQAEEVEPTAPQPAVAQQVAAPQVSSLPETGIGFHSAAAEFSGFALLILSGTGLIIASLKRGQRVP